MNRVLTQIFKTGFIESIPGKGVKIEKLEFDLEKLEFLVLAENMKNFIYRCNVFYPAKWQFQNPCED